MMFSIIARAAGALALGLATNYAAEAAKEKFLRDNADLIKKAKLRNKKVKSGRQSLQRKPMGLR